MAEQIPGWHPDPTGRHQHRFWDGTAWTDGVADGGVVGSDPVDLRLAEVPRGSAPAGGDGVRVERHRRWPKVALAAAVALVVVVGGALLLGGGGSGTGGVGRTVETVRPGHPASRSIHLRAGQAVGFEVQAASKDVRFRVAIAVDRGSGTTIQRTFGSDLSDPYAGSDYSAFFSDGSRMHHLLFAGRMRGFYAESFVAPASGTYTLAVQVKQAARLRIDIATQTKKGLASSYSPVELYRLRRDAAYKTFFAQWDRRSQGDVGAFTDFSDPYSGQASAQMSDYFSEYSDYVDTDTGSSGSSGNSGTSGRSGNSGSSDTSGTSS